MNEKIRKFILYTQPTKTYWKPTKLLVNKIESKIGFYPLSIAPRIEQGHYPYFDSNGIPMFPNKDGIEIHHYTTLCSYALGKWEQYLLSGDEEIANHLIKTADFLLESHKDNNGTALFLDFDDETENDGQPCAMNQGEAISVLIRAHQLSNNDKYLQLANAATIAYEHEYGSKGIVRVLPEIDDIWYQEGGKFILNGHNYAVWGLWELYNYTKDERILNLFNKGLKSIEKALPYFDNGTWSWYWLDKPLYIASMMYHNLHIVQLDHLAEQTNSEIIAEYNSKFKKYASNPINRIKSAVNLFKSKVS